MLWSTLLSLSTSGRNSSASTLLSCLSSRNRYIGARSRRWQRILSRRLLLLSSQKRHFLHRRWAFSLIGVSKGTSLRQLRQKGCFRWVNSTFATSVSSSTRGRWAWRRTVRTARCGHSSCRTYKASQSLKRRLLSFVTSTYSSSPIFTQNSRSKSCIQPGQTTLIPCGNLLLRSSSAIETSLYQPARSQKCWSGWGFSRSLSPWTRRIYQWWTRILTPTCSVLGTHRWMTKCSAVETVSISV